jgi:REP element-mobilizing transposase RayT
MARPLRIEYPGAVYHVTSRGKERREVFFTDDDRGGFLTVLGEVCKRFDWLCHSYCLMSNHYHLLLETPQANLSKGMRQLNGVYTKQINRRHGWVGHLLQGRFQGILVEKDSYLLELARYIVLNPVRAGMVDRAEDWGWSSYRASVGLEASPGFLTTDWVLSSFVGGRAAKPGRHSPALSSKGREKKALGRGSEGKFIWARSGLSNRCRRVLVRIGCLRGCP